MALRLGPSALAAMKAAQHDLLDPVWPAGRNPAVSDGTHYVAKGYARPVSLSRLEAFVLAELAYRLAPRLVVEIGTGFGYSSAWLGLGAVAAYERTEVLTLDNLSEGGLGMEGQSVAADLHARLGLSRTIKRITADASKAFPAALRGRDIDLAFIDADHHGDAPTRDWHAIGPFMSEHAVVAFHDVDPERYTVPDAVAAARAEGWIVATLPTSCFLTLLGRSASFLEMAADVVTDARAEVEVFDGS